MRSVDPIQTMYWTTSSV